jgi:hypothetical protein
MPRRLALIFIVLLHINLPARLDARKPAAKKTATKAAPKSPKDALIAAADEIARQVAALRGLPLEKPLQRGVLSREEIGAKLKDRIGKEFTTTELRDEARVLKRIGLLPQDVDYEKLLLDLLMEQVAGFYDPYAGKLYIADWLPLETMQRPALAHEIEHALQDQHFNLKNFAAPIKDDGDRQLARSALVEGDGTAVMLEFQAQAMGLPVDQLPELIAQLGKQMMAGMMGGSSGGGMPATPQLDNAPPVVKETLIFPYLAGLQFVAQLRRSAPWSRIDEVFKSPPESTEQIMHPEKYVAHEHPVKVTATPLTSLAGKKELRRDVFGELALKILFATAPLPPTANAAAANDGAGKSKAKTPPTPAPPGDNGKATELAEAAASGWGGDRMAAYADAASATAPPTVIDLSVWDTEGDAKEAETVARRLMQKLADGDGGKDEWLATRDGDKLVMVFGAPAGSGNAVAAEVLKSWKVSR